VSDTITKYALIARFLILALDSTSRVIMKTVKYDITYTEKASRIELFVRFVWSIPSYIVAAVLAFIMCIAMCFQWLCILFMGKRNKMLHDWIMKGMEYTVKWQTYFYLLTDERNPLLPED